LVHKVKTVKYWEYYIDGCGWMFKVAAKFIGSSGLLILRDGIAFPKYDLICL
jgi:hypothetical protein